MYLPRDYSFPAAGASAAASGRACWLRHCLLPLQCPSSFIHATVLALLPVHNGNCPLHLPLLHLRTFSSTHTLLLFFIFFLNSELSLKGLFLNAYSSHSYNLKWFCVFPGWRLAKIYWFLVHILQILKLFSWKRFAFCPLQIQHRVPQALRTCPLPLAWRTVTVLSS